MARNLLSLHNRLNIQRERERESGFTALFLCGPAICGAPSPYPAGVRRNVASSKNSSEFFAVRLLWLLRMGMDTRTPPRLGIDDIYSQLALEEAPGNANDVLYAFAIDDKSPSPPLRLPPRKNSTVNHRLDYSRRCSPDFVGHTQKYVFFAAVATRASLATRASPLVPDDGHAVNHSCLMLERVQVRAK